MHQIRAPSPPRDFSAFRRRNSEEVCLSIGRLPEYWEPRKRTKVRSNNLPILRLQDTGVYAGVAWRGRGGSSFESRGPRGARRAIGQLGHLAHQQSYLLCQLDVGVDRLLQEFTVRRHTREQVLLSWFCRCGRRRCRGRHRSRSWPFSRPLRTLLGGRGCCCSRAPWSPARHDLER